MKKYHFISGTPRSGSTLLSTILNQNPKFNANISSPLARFVRAIITESHAGPGYHLQCNEEKRIKLIQGLLDNYYYDTDKEVCFNTNRGWTALVDVLNITHPDAKVICCVRSIVDILNSFEHLFRKNPFSISKMYSSTESENVYSRSLALMSPGHTVKFALDSVTEAVNGPNANKLFLVEYNDLAQYPEETMRSLYNFIDEPYFNHDFSSVEATYDEYDQDANINGLHTIRKGVSYIEKRMILPPDLVQHFKNAETWR